MNQAQKDRNEKFGAQQLADDIRHVLANDAGRRVVWWMLSELTERSILAPGVEVHWNAALHDKGRALAVVMATADADAYALMEAEGRKRAIEDFKVRTTRTATQEKSNGS